ncbi:membrane protein [Tianweitania populi]|uniref:Membrane protein n=1 Tax=Tianweitania populi TaxID=1607949 RepID=A0A8J3DNN7_9HYPH|nr:membrane protein [Tianweitania populi]
MQFALVFIGYLAGVNLLAYAAMVLDKSKARKGARRIRETTLLNLALIGGSFGTVIAQQTIRHKTQKKPFRSRLRGIILFQAFVVVALTLALIMTGLPEALLQRIASFD